MALRDDVLCTLEALRQEKKIASNQEAEVLIQSDDNELISVINDFGIEQFAALCIVSEVKLQPGGPETKVTAKKSQYQKCQRCWNYWPSVGTDSQHPDLCTRCVEVVSKTL